MKQCVDHKGKPYPSVKDMCAAYGISYEVYNGRISRGWSKKDALTAAEGETRKKKPGFEVESNKPSVEYKRFLEYKLNSLNSFSTPYIWADQIHDLHLKIKDMDAMAHWMRAMDSYLTGDDDLDKRTKEQIAKMLNNPESIFADVVNFDREFHVSGYFEKWPVVEA